MHRAGDLKVFMIPEKGFEKPNKVRDRINEWLKSNPEVNVVDIKYGIDGIGFSAMIIYKDS